MILFGRIGRYITLPLAFLMSAAVSQNLGIDAVGYFGYWGTVISLISTVIVFGTGQSMWGKLANMGEAASAQVFLQIYILISCVVAAPLLLCAYVLGMNLQLTSLLTAAVLLMSFNTFVKNHDALHGRLARFYINDAVYYSVGLLILFLGLVSPNNIIMVYVVPLFSVALFFSSSFIRKILGEPWEFRLSFEMLAGSFSALVGVLVGLFAYKLIIMYAGSALNSVQMGYFVLLYSILDALVMLQASLLMADMKQLRENGERHLKKVLFFQLILAVLVTIGFIAAGPLVISLAYNVNIEVVRSLLFPFLVLFLFMIPYKVFQNYALANGKALFYVNSNFALLGVSSILLALSNPSTPSALLWNQAFALAAVILFMVLFYYMQKR